MEYREDDFLMLSGIQHFYFCKRQWCLIHIEQQWKDNLSTKEGEIIHEKVDNPYIRETREDIFFSRGMAVSSKKLGLSGILDLVEFRKNNKGITIENRDGKWLPYIVEYKRGKEKKDNRDIIQLAAEVICLEEKLNCKIQYSYLYYNQTRTRIRVVITDELRAEVYTMADNMHNLYNKKLTIRADHYKNCTKCSLYDLCLPKITKKKINIDNYILNMID